MSLQRSHVLGLRPRACEGTDWIRRKGGHWFSGDQKNCVVHRKQCIVLLYGRETPRWPGTGLVYNRGTFAIGRPCLEILSLSISYWMCVGVCVRRWNLCIRMWVFARLMFQLLYKTVYMSVCLFPSVLLTLRMCVHRDETKNIYSEREIRQYVHRKLGWSYLLLY